MRRVQSIVLISFAIFISSASSRAADFYAQVPFEKLTIVEGIVSAASQPASGEGESAISNRHLMTPRIVVDGTAEAYFAAEAPYWDISSDQLKDQNLLIHADQNGTVTGSIFIFKTDDSHMQRMRFQVKLADFASTPDAFAKAKLGHFEALLRSDAQGKAIFRHEVMELQKQLGQQDSSADDNGAGVQSDSELQETFDLFTGGRAISENLQLNHSLPSSTQPASADVKLSDIKGIALREIDWTPFIRDAHPSIDPLAKLIPADQHAFIFPSVPAAVGIGELADQKMGMMISAINSATGDANVRGRYERQLGLSMNSLSKVLGPMMVKSVAITGSDLYLPEGTDLAVIFEANDAPALKALLQARLMLTAVSEPTARAVDGSIAGIKYNGLISEDRCVSSYIAIIANAVVVSNSLSQLEKLANVAGGSPALASLPEYTFFRSRYAIGKPEESAFLILSDATIRRWCSPQWRIAESRRLRSAAVLAEIQAANINSLATGTTAAETVKPIWSVPQLDEVKLDLHGANSAVYGRLGFLTPISELKLDLATKSESEAYDRWRGNYESDFKRMDPIAARLETSASKVAVDLTVMPLVLSSDYETFTRIVGNSKLTASSGDPHEALAQLVMAIDPKSKPVGDFSQTMKTFAGDVKIDPLGWVGQSVSYYADDDPFWNEWAKAKDWDRYMQDHLFELPIGIYIESSSPLKLAAFLTACHSFVDQSAPNIVRWETLKFGETTYVRVKATEGVSLPNSEKLALYYVALPKALVISLNENVIKRAIDRLTTSTTQPATQPTRPWLGESLAARLQPKIWQSCFGKNNLSLQTNAQATAWNNIAVLNEIRHKLPQSQAVDVYEKLFGVTLVDGGSGKFIWNDQWQTYESTAYGSPANPKVGPTLADTIYGMGGAFGVTFENSGLRGRAEIDLPADK